MPLLKPPLQKQVREALADMTAPVRVVVVTSDADQQACEICDDTRQLVEELAWLSEGKIATEVVDLARDAERARDFGVDKAPALVILGGADGSQDRGIRFFGIPSGYEFASLVAAVRMVSTGTTSLTRATLDALARLETPLHLRVFVTPTCPYCPAAVILAHQLAIASDKVTAEMIDASEFPELADRYRVHAVPRTVINDTLHVEGAVPEATLLQELERVAAA